MVPCCRRFQIWLLQQREILRGVYNRNSRRASVCRRCSRYLRKERPRVLCGRHLGSGVWSCEMSPEFRAVFYSVLGLTAGCGIAATAILICLDPLTVEQKQLTDTLLWLFTLGAGAIIGLLGGTAISKPADSNGKKCGDARCEPRDLREAAQHEQRRSPGRLRDGRERRRARAIGEGRRAACRAANRAFD